MAWGVSVETVRETFAYDAKSGMVVWKRPGGRYGQYPVGTPAGSINGQKARYIHLERGQNVRAHHVVWALHHGAWPEEELLHLDRNPGNDRIENLCLKSKAPKAEFGYQSVVQNSDLTAETLRSVLDYDSDTGVLSWRQKVGRSTSIGRAAGSPGNHGHWQISLGGRDYLGGRLAWLYVHGVWPRRLVYLNGDKRDLRIANLAEKVALPKRFDHSTPEGKAAYAKAFREANPDYVKDKQLVRSFGLRLAEYNAMLAAQSGGCAICRKPETEKRVDKARALAVDHDHQTGAVRGLLCTACNKMIGLACDDPTILRAAIRYLETNAALSDAA